MLLETNLQTIEQNALDKQKENDAFVPFVKNINSKVVDEKVSNLNNIITPKIDCLQCGNCCKSLMINVEEDEAIKVSHFLNISIETFEKTYVDKGFSGRMIMNKMPCHFLQNNNACSVYENRFDGCREFPALHLPQFNNRLFTVFMHYNRCPIIYNVIEELKVSLNFNR